jgi:hypothetical protein
MINPNSNPNTNLLIGNNTLIDGPFLLGLENLVKLNIAGMYSLCFIDLIFFIIFNL